MLFEEGLQVTNWSNKYRVKREAGKTKKNEQEDNKREAQEA